MKGRQGQTPKLFTHRFVVGASTVQAHVPGGPHNRCVWEDKRPSGSPDERGTLLVLGVGESRRTYVIGSAVKDPVARTVRYRCYEVHQAATTSTGEDIGHADVVAAVRRAPRQVATLLRQLLGSTYAVCMAIGAVSPEVYD